MRRKDCKTPSYNARIFFISPSSSLFLLFIFLFYSFNPTDLEKLDFFNLSNNLLEIRAPRVRFLWSVQSWGGQLVQTQAIAPAILMLLGSLLFILIIFYSYFISNFPSFPLNPNSVSSGCKTPPPTLISLSWSKLENSYVNRLVICVKHQNNLRTNQPLLKCYMCCIIYSS